MEVSHGKILAGIPSLKYANDTMFLMEGSIEEAWILSLLLNIFIDCLSLQINRAKSSFVGYGLSHKEDIQYLRALGTPIETLPIY